MNTRMILEMMKCKNSEYVLGTVRMYFPKECTLTLFILLLFRSQSVSTWKVIKFPDTKIFWNFSKFSLKQIPLLFGDSNTFFSTELIFTPQFYILP